MEYLADVARVVAVLLEELRQRDDLGHRVAVEGVDVFNFQRARAKSGQGRGARRPADGVLHVGAVEAHAGGGQPVDVRALDVLYPVGAQFRAEIVHGDKQHVRAIGRARGGEGEQGEAEEAGELSHASMDFNTWPWTLVSRRSRPLL